MSDITVSLSVVNEYDVLINTAEGVPGLNPFNQSLNTTDDVQFNSVKGPFQGSTYAWIMDNLGHAEFGFSNQKLDENYASFLSGQIYFNADDGSASFSSGNSIVDSNGNWSGRTFGGNFINASEELNGPNLHADLDGVRFKLTPSSALAPLAEAGVIYFNDTDGKFYGYNGTEWDALTAPATTDALPEGTTNKYFTNARASSAAPVQSVAGKTGAVTLAKGDVGLGNVDNTSDLNKPISTATQTALDGKQPVGSYLTDAPSDGSTYGRKNGAWSAVVSGNPFDQSLNTTDSPSFYQLYIGNDFSIHNDGRIQGNGYQLNAGGDANFDGGITINGGTALAQPDWDATSGWGQILNKPDIFSGQYYDLQSIPTSFTPSAHASSHASGGSDALTLAASQITGLASVATSGSASDLGTGTLPLARLNSLVSLDNQNNNFTSGQSITAAANTSALTASYSVTGANTTALVNLSGTWNTTGLARGILLNLTDTASATASVLADFGTGGASYRTQYALTKSRQFWLYNSSPTTQDASNYERAFIRWNSNVLEIGAEAAGTGTVRAVSVISNTGQTTDLYAGGVTSTPAIRTRGTSYSTVYVGLEWVFSTQSADPTTSDIPSGRTRMVKNTTSGALKLWANDGGTLKSVTLS